MKKAHQLWQYSMYVLICVMPNIVQAQLIDNNRKDACNFGEGTVSMACIPIFIGDVIVFIFGFLGAIFFIMGLWGAYEYAFSGLLGTGEEGKKRIKNAILGFTLCMCAFYILNFIITSFTGAPAG